MELVNSDGQTYVSPPNRYVIVGQPGPGLLGRPGPRWGLHVVYYVLDGVILEHTIRAFAHREPAEAYAEALKNKYEPNPNPTA